MIELFHFGYNDRSSKVRWMLCELGLPYEDRKITSDERFEPPFSDLNPFGLVPAIRRDDGSLHDAGAIVMTLALEHPESGLLPEDHRERAKCQEWCWFAASSLEGATLILAYLKQAAPDSPVAKFAESRLNRFLDVLDREVAGKSSILQEFSIADILLAYPLKGIRSSGALEGREGISQYLVALEQRPASVTARFWD